MYNQNNQKQNKSLNDQVFQDAAPVDASNQKPQQVQIKPSATLKYLLLGGAGCGKSALLFSFVQNIFLEKYLSTIGVDFKVKTIPYKNQYYKLQIWDTAGQERFRTITTSYYKGAHCFYLVYDCTNYEQFLNLPNFLKDIDKFGNQNHYICLVGTKNDLVNQKQVSTEMGMQFASQYKIDFMQVNAIPDENGHKLDELFMKGIQWYVQKK